MAKTTAGVTRPPLPRSFYAWVSGTLASQLGDAALFFALGWTASAHGGAAAGLVLSAIGLARTLLLLIGGTVGDRLGAHRILIAGNSIMLAVSAALAVVASRWGLPLASLVAVGVIIGAVDAFSLPASGSMPRRLVDAAQLPRALALRQGGTQLVSIAGGPLGGLVVVAAGFAAAATLDAATFAIVLAVLIAIRPQRTTLERAPRQHLAREALDGVRVAVRTTGLGPTLLLLAGAAGFILPVGSLLIPLLARAHAWPAHAAGLLVGAQGAGAVLISVIVARSGSHPRPAITALLGLVITALGQIALAIAPTVSIASGGAAAMGIGTGLFISHLSPVVLSAAPLSHLSRIQSLISLVQAAALAATNNILGNIAHAFQPRSAILLCAAVLTVCALGGYSSRTIRQLTSTTRQHRDGARIP